MIVYGDPKTSATLGEAVAALRGLKGRELVIASGMFEQGLADAGLATGDFTEVAARNWLGGNDATVVEEIRAPRDTKLTIKTPEGFAFYEVYPEQYVNAAREFLKAKGAGSYVVVGIRSIGTSLSAAVAEVLRMGGADVRRCTVRPHGDPFSREVDLPAWVDDASDGYLVVNEGPGMSGSSFVATRVALTKMGVPAEKIHFFTGHPNAPGAAASEETRRIWAGTTRWHVPLVDTAFGNKKGLFEVLKEREERFDFPVVWKFAGQALPWPFDCSGAAEGNARRIAERSCGLPVLDAVDGWLAFPFVNGQSTKVALERLADHIVAAADEPLRREDEMEAEARLREMLMVNVRKYFADVGIDGALKGWLEELVFEAGQKSSGDGHMERRHWIADGMGKLWKLKTTGSKLSHHVAYLLPALWDVAQVVVEWNLRREEEKEFCAALRTGGLRVDRRELAFFKMAYAALELGKCVMFGADAAVTKAFERRLLRSMREQFVW
jgi:hypothetical protein